MVVVKVVNTYGAVPGRSMAINTPKLHRCESISLMLGNAILEFVVVSEKKGIGIPPNNRHSTNSNFKLLGFIMFLIYFETAFVF